MSFVLHLWTTGGELQLDCDGDPVEVLDLLEQKMRRGVVETETQLRMHGRAESRSAVIVDWAHVITAWAATTAPPKEASV